MVCVIHLWKLNIKVGVTREREVLIEIFTVSFFENNFNMGVDDSEELRSKGIILFKISIMEVFGLKFKGIARWFVEVMSVINALGDIKTFWELKVKFSLSVKVTLEKIKEVELIHAVVAFIFFYFLLILLI